MPTCAKGEPCKGFHAGFEVCRYERWYNVGLLVGKIQLRCHRSLVGQLGRPEDAEAPRRSLKGRVRNIRPDLRVAQRHPAQ